MSTILESESHSPTASWSLLDETMYASVSLSENAVNISYGTFLTGHSGILPFIGFLLNPEYYFAMQSADSEKQMILSAFSSTACTLPKDFGVCFFSRTYYPPQGFDACFSPLFASK